MPDLLSRLQRGELAAELANARRLDLRPRPGQPRLAALPPAVFELADTLEELDLSGNALTNLPAELPRLHRLKVLFASDNPFEALPPVLGDCEALELVGFKACRIERVESAALPPLLRWLILTGNRLRELPAALGRRQQLQKLMLAGNALADLPDLSGCRRLELVRLAANRLQHLPHALLELPRLAWLALAGNPGLAGAGVGGLPRESLDATLRRIDAAALQTGAVLGRGASGVIRQALWHKPGQVAEPVAVKQFHAAMTSDGSPQDERAAWISAAGGPGQIDLHGVVDGGDHHGALVMALLPVAFRPLAGPPSLSSCTRDVYADDQCLPAQAVGSLTRQVVAAVAHLHGCQRNLGVMHGDLYAHNLLWNGDAAAPQVFLSDFGAATAYDRSAPAAATLERLEVRAFGILLGELLERLDEATAAGDVADLVELREACQSEASASRPSFAEIRDVLEHHR